MHTKKSVLELGGGAPSFSYKFAVFLQNHLLIRPILNELTKGNIYRVKTQYHKADLELRGNKLTTATYNIQSFVFAFLSSVIICILVLIA